MPEWPGGGAAMRKKARKNYAKEYAKRSGRGLQIDRVPQKVLLRSYGGGRSGALSAIRKAIEKSIKR